MTVSGRAVAADRGARGGRGVHVVSPLVPWSGRGGCSAGSRRIARAFRMQRREGTRRPVPVLRRGPFVGGRPGYGRSLEGPGRSSLTHGVWGGWGHKAPGLGPCLGALLQRRRGMRSFCTARAVMAHAPAPLGSPRPLPAPVMARRGQTMHPGGRRATPRAVWSEKTEFKRARK